jgi:hypothetical protein
MSYLHAAAAMLLAGLLPIAFDVDPMYALLAQLPFLAAWFDTAEQPK